MTDTTAAPRVSLGRAFAAALCAPVVVAAGALALLTGWAAELPDPMAVHFGAGGEADGFASVDVARASVFLGPATAAVLVAVLVLVTGRDLRTARTGVALASGVGAFLAALPALLAIPQRGVPDAAGVPVPGWWMALGLVVGVLAAALAHLAVPAPGTALAAAAPAADAPRIALAVGERVAWAGSAAMPRLIGVVVGLVPLGCVVALTATGTASTVVLLVVAALSATLMAVLLAPVRVVVDRTGVTARAVVAFRPIHVPLEEVAEARAVTVRVLNGFGGYGYRIGPRGVGLIARPGPALEVTRGDGSRLTVTVDGADEAAAVLNALAARGRI